MFNLRTTEKMNRVFDLRTPLNLKINRTALKMFLLTFSALFFSNVGATFAAPAGTTPIFRAQIRVVTANVSNAESDDYVKVDLNSDNRTWIESDQDDFARGDDQTYDLRLQYVSQLSDIRYLKIEKTGSDAWVVRQIYLIINGRTIYSRDFGTNGIVLDNDSDKGRSRVYFIDGSFMRATTTWMNYSSPAKPYIISRDDMRLRLESVVGDFVAYDWLIQNQSNIYGLLMHREGNYGTELFTINADTWRVDLDLEADDFYWNIDIDVDFNLKIECLNGRPNFIVSGVTASSTPDTNSTDRARDFVRNLLAQRLNDMMQNFTYGPCSEMRIVLSSNGDLNITPRVLPPVFIRNGEPVAPIKLEINSRDNIEPYQQTAFAATVTNESAEETEADFSFDLSPGIFLTDGMIEARDFEGTRQIGVKEIVRQTDGSSKIVFSDRLRASTNTEYTLRLFFQPQENQALQIVTKVQVVSSKAAAHSPTRAITEFIFKSGVIKQQPSLIGNSTANASKSEAGSL